MKYLKIYEAFNEPKKGDIILYKNTELIIYNIINSNIYKVLYNKPRLFKKQYSNFIFSNITLNDKNKIIPIEKYYDENKIKTINMFYELQKPSFSLPIPTKKIYNEIKQIWMNKITDIEIEDLTNKYNL